MKLAKSFMAISRGAESTEGGEFKRYIGVAPCYVKAVNPSKGEIEKIFDSTLEKEPEYTGKVKVQDKTTGAEAEVDNVRITFIVQPDSEKIGMEVSPISVSMFLQKRYRYNNDKTKVQVIDKYGRTAWVTIDQAKNHEIPMYKNGPANLDKDYRPAYVGEEELTNFLIAYLNIPAVMKYNQNEGKWYMVDNPQDSECRLDHIEDYFKSNFKELQEAVSFQPNNKIKIMFGVRTSNEGKQYQAAYTNMFLRNSVSDYSKLDKDLQERKNAGAFSSTEFSAGEFKEYKVESTPLTPQPLADLPFGDPFGV